MTQIELALAAQEDMYVGVVWIPVGDPRYFEEDCYCDDDDDWGMSDAEWLRQEGIVDAEGNPTPIDWDNLVYGFPDEELS